MAHDQDGQIGRAVIGALVVQRLAADGAAFADLEIAAQERAGPAGRAATAPAAQHGGAERAVFEKILAQVVMREVSVGHLGFRIWVNKKA